MASASFASAATPIIQVAFLVYESEKTWNSYRILGLIDVENSSPRAPYIERQNLGEFTVHKAQRGNSKCSHKLLRFRDLNFYY